MNRLPALLLTLLLAAVSATKVRRNNSVHYERVISRGLHEHSMSVSYSKSSKSGKGSKSSKSLPGGSMSISYSKSGGKKHSHKKNQSSKSGKGTKSSKGGGTPPPTTMPTPPPNNAPTAAPPVVDYSLLYDIEQSRLPLGAEYRAVASATNEYLNDYFATAWGNIFVTSVTEITGTIFNFGQPLEIEWSTSLEFLPGMAPPPIEEVESTLYSAFEGSGNADYLALIQGLPSVNLFSTSESIVLVRADGSTSRSSSRFSALLADNLSILVAAAAGAGLLAFLVGGVALHRRREDAPDGKKSGEDGQTLHSDTMAETIDTRPSYRTAILNPSGTVVDDDRDIQEMGELHEVDLTL